LPSDGLSEAGPPSLSRLEDDAGTALFAAVRVLRRNQLRPHFNRNAIPPG
jgi:hypothetical protein